MRGTHYETKYRTSVRPVAIGTTGTGQTGTVIDTIVNGIKYRRAKFVISYGSVTATNAVFTLIVKEGDVTGTMTSIADGDLEGTELAAGLAAAASRTSNSTKNVTKTLGYKGKKRYLQVGKLSSTVTAGTPVAGLIELSDPETAPVN